MRILNNKGFTLVEVLAVIVIIALIGGIAIPNVLNTINTSKNASEKIMIENIITASEQLYEEVEFTGNIYQYEGNGTKSQDIISIQKDSDKESHIETNLQTLVSNGFLSGTGKDANKIIINPKTGENIGACGIIITKKTDDNYKVTYKINPSNNNSSKCPSTYLKEVS